MTKERQPLHFLFAKAICLSFLGNGGCGRPYTSAVSAGSSAQALRLEHQCPAMLVSPEAPATIRHDFRVGNPSATTPMTLTLVEQSCGCIRHILSQEATPPLGDVSISLETDLPMATGVTRRHVTFSTNLAELPRVDLSLCCQGYARIAFVPNEPLRYELEPNGRRRVDGLVEIFAPLDAALGEIELTQDGAGISVEESGRTKELVDGAFQRVATRYSLAVEARPDEDGNYDHQGYMGAIICRHRGRSCAREVYWQALAAIRHEPSALYLKAGQGPDHRRAKSIHLQGPRPFQVRSASSSIVWITIAFDSASRRAEHDLQVSIAKRAAIPSGLHKGWIDVDLDGPDEPRLRIRVLVWGATGST